MLKYIQKSTSENVTNEDIASVQKLVDKVKRKREVGINYMKSWEYEKMIKDEAREAGFNDGVEKMSQLIIRLTDAGRTDDIVKATHNADYREQLFKEFDL